MPSNYSSYSRMRDIAVKRAGRLAQSGLSASIHIPTVKELKEAGISAKQAEKNLAAYLEAPTTVREFKRIEESKRPVFIVDRTGPIVTSQERKKKEEQLLRQRERNRRYRERIRNLSKQEKSYMKAARTLGVHITPSQAKAFAEYMDFRFAQGSDSVHYKIARYVEDYISIIAKKGYTPDEILSDFNLFLSDRAGLMDRAGAMAGVGPEDIDDLFEEFIYD